MQRRAPSITIALTVILFALLACKKGDDSQPTTSSAKPAEPVAPPAPTPAPLNARTAPVDVDEKGIPAIPEGRSDPPSVAEWTAAKEINTQEVNSRAKDCFVKIVREWTKVHCDGDIKSITDMQGIPKANSDYFESVRHGTAADFVFRLKKGSTMQMKIHRSGNRASLFINWPAAKDRPVNVALAQIKEGDEAAGANAVQKDDDEATKKAKKVDQEAYRKCKTGDKGACMQHCGADKCD